MVCFCRDASEGLVKSFGVVSSPTWSGIFLSQFGACLAQN